MCPERERDGEVRARGSVVGGGGEERAAEDGGPPRGHPRHERHLRGRAQPTGQTESERCFDCQLIRQWDLSLN